MAKATFPRGSEWRKWDLHVHPPGGKLYDGYKAADGTPALDRFCRVLEESDVAAFGITDYFSADSFGPLLERYGQMYPNSQKVLFFNLELRLNETVNKALEEVDIHLIFNPASFNKVPKFLSHLAVTQTGGDGVKIRCSELKTSAQFESATVTRDAIQAAFVETFGPKAVREDHFLVITAANNDGLRPERGRQRKEIICDEIDKTSDAFFGSAKNVPHYLNIRRYEDGSESPKRPTLAGSDSHSFDDLESALGKQRLRVLDEGGAKREIIDKDVTWIKADLTYDGLKQLLYEPESGERVFIGPNKPDTKEDYKVISRIKFEGSSDFPQEVVFNSNLCSIIGSRSSGKSALLAYIAHSIDPAQVEAVTDGPGEGDEHRWENVSLRHSVEWANGKGPNEIGGSVVYVRQNYLFEKSKDSDEVKRKIEPVLFKLLPDFHSQYEQATATIEGENAEIAESVEEWFGISEDIKGLDAQLKEIGDKKAIEQQQKATDEQIKAVQEKNKLSAEDLERYRAIRAEAGVFVARNKDIDRDLAQISNATEEHGHFSSARLHFTPVIGSVPTSIQDGVKRIAEDAEAAALKAANKIVWRHKEAITKEKADNLAAIEKIKETNKALIERHNKNVELEPLIKASAAHAELLRKIAAIEVSRKDKELKLAASAAKIHAAIQARASQLEALNASMEAADQSSLRDLKFGVEYAIDPADLERVTQGLNLRERTDFVDRSEVQLDAVRNDPGKFLSALYTGKQKTKERQMPRTVATNVLQLTEKILFTALMEGDRIGGFAAPTMTPGKRALFALRLILAESEDTWPLLIDQPEDDLDSRAIFDEVVPFLKAKKKERQIIMVSHNANLVIGSDAEQVVVANRNGNDRRNADGKQFNYLTGSLEFSNAFDPNCPDTLGAQGVCEHACSILDGGKTAFESRKNKYQIR